MIESGKKLQNLKKSISIKPALSMTTDEDSKSKSKSGDETEEQKTMEQSRKLQDARKPIEQPKKVKKRQQNNRRLDEFLPKKSVNQFQAIAIMQENQKLKDYLQQTEKEIEEYTIRAVSLLQQALQENIKLRQSSTKLQIVHIEPPNPSKSQQPVEETKNQLSLLLRKHQQNKLSRKLEAQQLSYDKNRRLKRQLFYQSNCCFKVSTPSWPLLLNKYQPVQLVYRSDKFQLYKGLNLRNLQDVAIKLYYVKSEATIKAVEREYRIHQKVQNHPNILQCLDYFQLESDKYGLIFQWAQYNLEQFSGAMTEDQTAAAIKQLCEALRHLKNQQIVHRAIKADNVYIIGDTIKLNNFSMALQGIETMLTVEKQNQNQRHVPPECQYTQAVTEKFDIWSLGLLILGCKLRVKSVNKGEFKKQAESSNEPTMRMASLCLSQNHSRPTIEALLKTFRK